MTANVQGEILNDIKKTYLEYKKDQTLIGSEKEASNTKINEKFNIFAAQIQVIASLFNSSETA